MSELPTTARCKDCGARLVLHGGRWVSFTSSPFVCSEVGPDGKPHVPEERS